MKNFFMIAVLLASSVSAHMQLSKPLPIRSPLNKDSKGKKDYSYTNPLSTSGEDFPCKGYANDPFHATANYTQGETYEMTMAGSATHKGGSCQIALSYDKGDNFHVIHSILGGCPIDKAYNFKIPSDAPDGEALIAWTWFNKIGNREMYMNCAQVNVGGGGGNGEQNRELTNDATANSQAVSFDQLPPIFVANVNGPGKCETVEGKDVNFPRPGPSVEGSVEGKGYKCDGDADFLDSGNSKTGNNKASSTSSASSSSSSQAHSILNTAAPNANGGKKHATAFGTPPPTNRKHASLEDNVSPYGGPPVGAPHPKAPHDGPSHDGPSHGGPPHGGPHGGSHDGHQGGPPHPEAPEHHEGPPGSLICAHDGKTFFRSTGHGRPTFMGPVAEGTVCRHGAIVAA